jgi:hypothetical protein
MIYSQHVFATMNYAKLRKLSFKANISAARAYRQTNDSLWFSPPLIRDVPDRQIVSGEGDGHGNLLARVHLNVGKTFEH